MKALAGVYDFQNYWEKLDETNSRGSMGHQHPFGKSLWTMETTLDALKQVSKKDLKYINKNWVNGQWDRRNWDENPFVPASGSIPAVPITLKTFENDTKRTEYYGPNGPNLTLSRASPWTSDDGSTTYPRTLQQYARSANMGENDRFLVEQKKDYKRFTDWLAEENARIQDSGRLTYDADRYNEWFTMHDNTIWFDTSACLHGNKFIGDINKMDVVPQNYDMTNGAWKRTSDIVGSHTYYNSEQMPYGNRYGLDTRVTTTTDLGWNGDEYKNLLQAQVDLMQDCDLDCQSRGTQLTVVAGLMTSVFAVIGLNSIFMFIGTWYFWARICSIYFTMVACMFQAAALIAAGAMLFTKYNMVCGRSLFYTFEPFLWHYGDDLFMTASIWVIAWFAMFIWAACGLCSAYRPMSK